ncbi:DUF4394 domain-containing protein [Pedobacter puniceum]|uniref:DUF4394 domain-containing protein n=1 Tax=Pedobacter puniceum TaxID=2666136 RepID=A0A7K0FTC6_9SPHI|nr:DUF4394 domain-containing protein [Pedobacter puniceum]MRX48357.1 DUF4394 domain-containing protein [Pedobacter puniceum]
MIKTFRHTRLKVQLLFLLLLDVGITACKKDSNNINKPDIVFYALGSNNQLMQYNANNTQMPMGATLNITGLQTSETILAIDFRPATGQLYGLGSSSRIYAINLNTGAATAIGSGAFTPAISGNILGFDFNPTVDRIRLVTSTGQNLRLHPETGAVAAVDGNINGINGVAISSSAYTNNKAGASSTTLFNIDVVAQKLYKQDPPNDGKLVEIGSLGISASTGNSGFDISADGIALATIANGSNTTLYQIDVNTGAATNLGNLASNAIGIAIPTEPVAYAVDDTNNLLIFNPKNPSVITKAITGLGNGENIVGIDFRPVNGQLYALSSGSRLYTINLASGAATAIGLPPLLGYLSGTSFGFDFNPTVDRIRVVSNTGQNLRLNPNDGALAATDGMLNPGTPTVTAAAYTNNFAGATTTVLFDIDVNSDRLFTQIPPNDGTLVGVGTGLGVNVDAANGFDIGGTTGIAYAILTSSNVSKIYQINLTTGIATAVADFPKQVRGFALGLGF